MAAALTVGISACAQSGGPDGSAGGLSITTATAASVAGSTSVTGPSDGPASVTSSSAAEAASSESTPPPSDESPVPPSPLPTTPRPAWLGSRTIPTGADGFGLPMDTPPELRNRAFATIDTLPPPVDDDFGYTVEVLADRPDVLARSTWAEGCQVPPEDLRYLTVGFHGFDGLAHTGELIVHREVADGIVGVFETLHDARFPIEEMRVVTRADLDAPPMGDTNNTSAYVCRPSTGGTGFSEHAYGLAVDINPFHNPYVKGDRVLPEQATVYADRSLGESGMIEPGDVVVGAFESIGWTWGGDWTSLKDYQHFSATGR